VAQADDQKLSQGVKDLGISVIGYTLDTYRLTQPTKIIGILLIAVTGGKH